MKAFVNFVFLLLNFKTEFIKSSNWAQTSGVRDQNIVITKIPSPHQAHWSARYGHSTSILHSGDSAVSGEVYLMGGDSYYGEQKETRLGILGLRRTNGYMNDVWKAAPTEWIVRSDVRLRNPKYKHNKNPQDQARHQKIPRVYSSMTWKMIQPGLAPRPGVPYEDWIICDPYFAGTNNKYSQKRVEMNCCTPENPDQSNCVLDTIQWSPRRHHASVSMVVDGLEYLFVMGGRAREFVDYKEEKSVGGIIGPRVKDPLDINQVYSSQREASVYKSDVWRSLDGRTWELVTPGCQAPQDILIPEGNSRESKYGTKLKQCDPARGNDDCYGAEICDSARRTCMCGMWTPREQFGSVAHNGWIYVVGGYTSQLYSKLSNCGAYACGETTPSSYRYYLKDVWKWNGDPKSPWIVITQGAEFSERGGLQLLAFPDKSGVDYLWIVGGRGGDNSGKSRDLIYYNDIWRAPINPQGSPGRWTNYSLTYTGDVVWSGRTGHTAVLETGTAVNGQVRRLYVIGGVTAEDPVPSTETWILQIDDPSDYWRKDFEADSLFSQGSGLDLAYRNNSPSTYYVSDSLDITYMNRFWLPLKVTAKVGSEPEKRPYVTGKRLEQLYSLNITTIRNLAYDADVYTILKLRGFSFPGDEEKMDFFDICDVRALAIAIDKKCHVDQNKGFYDGENQHARYVVPQFADGPPVQTGPKDGDGSGNWHGRDYMFLAPITGYDELVGKWDGCTILNLPPLANPLAFNNKPNVEGLGWVEQVKSIKDPSAILQELQCRYYPKGRAYHSALFFDEKIYLFGGKSREDLFNANSWYRDSRFPTVYMTTKPRDFSTDKDFIFSCDEPGCLFQYRVWDPYNYKELMPWTPVVYRADVRWLDWRNNGPGNGEYILYVRAVDPAGNYDTRYREGINYHRWNYVSPTPWDIIAEGVCGFLGLCGIGYLEYRRRMKKAAMERYAMKRMRRKFKALQKDMEGGEVDWRTLYNETKAKGELGKKGTKAKVDKQKEKRDADKKKRDKEKENIKKKLKAGKDFKEKKRQEAMKSDESSKKTKKKSKKEKEEDAAGGTVAIIDEDEKADEPSGDPGKSPPPKLKDYEKAGGGGANPPKLKDYEKGKVGAEEKDAKEPKLKDYEKSAASNNEENTAKQRKTNKRYKDYEAKDDDKKDV